MCISYTIREIPDKGRGVFATEAIPSGSIVWRHVAGQYSVYDEGSLISHLSSVSDGEAMYVLEHIYCMHEFPKYMIRVLDDGALINHSDHPTLGTHTKPAKDKDFAATSPEAVSAALLRDYFSLVAIRDIEEGEELTLDYNDDTDDPAYYHDLCEKYGVSWDWL